MIRAGGAAMAGRVAVGVLMVAAVLASPAGTRRLAAGSPIEHVVVIFQENHSFDNVLGVLCVDDGRCDGATAGKISSGATIPLLRAGDVSPKVNHNSAAQLKAINGGKMNGFDQIAECGRSGGYNCYVQYHPDQIPNLAALARAFTISDRTFSLDPVPSWGAHLALVAATLDGFIGNNPLPVDGQKTASGWGCDSKREALWKATPSSPGQWMPSCIPTKLGTGPYRPSLVPWTPTIMERLDAAGRSWRIYAGGKADGYAWAICPSFATCLNTSQRQRLVANGQFRYDAINGRLPDVSLVMPRPRDSQHNGYSMLQGDNYIADLVSAVMDGPDWPTTAIFITYDDCGCFYDHVAPPAGRGIRMPMVIVSPYAKPGYTDRNVASFASLLAYIERTFDVQPLTTLDATAYDYGDSFDYAQDPLPPIELSLSIVPQESLDWIATNPVLDED